MDLGGAAKVWADMQPAQDVDGVLQASEVGEGGGQVACGVEGHGGGKGKARCGLRIEDVHCGFGMTKHIGRTDMQPARDVDGVLQASEVGGEGALCLRLSSRPRDLNACLLMHAVLSCGIVVLCSVCGKTFNVVFLF
jgi:hypothetical protein